MRIIAGQQNDLAGANLDRSFAFDGKKKPSADDDVIDDQLSRRVECEFAVVSAQMSQDAPWRRELRIEKNAT